MFSKYEERCFIKIQIARGKNARQCHTALLEACGRETSPYRTVARWKHAFRNGREDVHQKRGDVRSQSASDDVYVNSVRALLQEHRCWTCIELAREVGIAPGTILHVLKKQSKMRTICARWVPHNFKVENMWQRIETARLHLERYGREGERVFRRIITLDETWVRCYQPKSKRQSSQKAWVDITARLEKPTYYGRNDHDFKIKCRKQKTDVEAFVISLLSKNLKVRIYKTALILPVVLHGCETWTLTLREEQRLRMFENKVLRKIFGTKRDAVTEEWRKLHNAELHAFYSTPDIIRKIKSRRLRWAGHVARMGESSNAYRVLVGRPEGKRPLERPRRRWEDNIKMDLREVVYDDRDWINLAQYRDRWRAYVRAAMNLRVP
ncbi:hypothetical protein ANN_22646 [Periplaneta americana]|uniref:Uncharacterized protein n=1 Tax=Periplaneta americana TaxID=6978 RepID=A0ABQ8S9C2_PERAM|nr:hypothetical protein ANN_22646 [Periplaneta americana]